MELFFPIIWYQNRKILVNSNISYQQLLPNLNFCNYFYFEKWIVHLLILASLKFLILFKLIYFLYIVVLRALSEIICFKSFFQVFFVLCYASFIYLKLFSNSLNLEMKNHFLNWVFLILFFKSLLNFYFLFLIFFM